MSSACSSPLLARADAQASHSGPPGGRFGAGGFCRGQRRYTARMSRTRFVVRHAVTTSLWFIPVVCLLAGIALAVITIAIDRATGGDLLPSALTGDPNAAV